MGVIVSTSFDEYCWLGPALSLPSIPVTKLACERNLGFVRIVQREMSPVMGLCNVRNTIELVKFPYSTSFL